MNDVQQKISEINGQEVCSEIVASLINNGFLKVFKVDHNKLIEVSAYEDSADYIFIKGSESLKHLF